MNVLIIPEDPQHDQHILKPIFEGLFRSIGKPRAKVIVCQDPVLGGVAEALKSNRIAQIIEQHRGMTDIFILCVDRDGVDGRRQRLNQIEQKFGNEHIFLAENAWQEIEIWALAGLQLPKEWRWADVRAEINVKEQYFEPYAVQRGLSDELGGGRKALGEKASRRISAIRQKCPEDFDSLARRLEAAI